jgi:predicted deacetylase
MLLVSIHDVTPALENRVHRLWDLCARSGIRPALLVVPNWHGSWPLEQYPGFVSWVRSCADQGSEILLHGERHDEVGLPRRLAHSWKAWGRTAGEAEFLTLSESAARERIQRGQSRLHSLGLEPVGFVPPAWLGAAATDRAVAAAGFAFIEDASEIRALPSGRRVTSPAVRWSGRTPARAWGSAVVADARWRLQRNSRWPRLALHPQDLDHPATLRSVERSVDRLSKHHPIGRYSELCTALGSR